MLAEQEGEYDADTRWVIAQFEQHAFEDGPYRVAETLGTAKNTSVQGMITAGVVITRAGKVRLLKRGELSEDWSTPEDGRQTVWKVTRHLV